MASRPPLGRDEEPSIGTLVSRLVEDGRAYAQAEVTLYKTIATTKLAASKVAIGLLAGAYLLVHAAVVVLLIALGMALGRWLGPAGGTAVAGVIGLVLAGIMAKVAIGQLSGGRS